MAIEDGVKRELKELYQPSAKKPQLLDVLEMPFLMIHGSGMPVEGGEFQQSFGAMYPVAYGMKFGLKKRGGFPEYRVYPPEGLWWAEGGGDLSTAQPDEWRWTMMIRQPEFVTAEMVAEFAAAAAKKKPHPLIARVALERFHEGLCVQMMHVGPYDAETVTIERLRQFAIESGLELRADGKHHEIYHSDPNRSAPERWKTVVRLPVRRV